MKHQRETSCPRPRTGLESSFLLRLGWERFLWFLSLFSPSAPWWSTSLMLEMKELNSVFLGKRTLLSRLILPSTSSSWSTSSSDSLLPQTSSGSCWSCILLLTTSPFLLHLYQSILTEHGLVSDFS